MELQLIDWKHFRAAKRKGAQKRFLHQVAIASVQAFKRGSAGAGGGRPGARRSASVPGQYPAVQTGRLIASLGTEVTGDTVTIGTNMHYSKYLRYGTSKMAARKMSDDALREGYRLSRAGLKGFVKWEHGEP